MSKRIIFIILLVLIPLNLLIAQDFVTEIDGAGNKVLVEYIGYDYDVVIPNDITVLVLELLLIIPFRKVLSIPDSVIKIGRLGVL